MIRIRDAARDLRRSIPGPRAIGFRSAIEPSINRASVTVNEKVVRFAVVVQIGKDDTCARTTTRGDWLASVQGQPV